MSGRVEGLGGTLLPERYVAVQLLIDRSAAGGDAAPASTARQLHRWWSSAADVCGPASPLRMLFDLVAMPLVALLGFRVRDATFENRQCRATLVTGRGTQAALLLTTWARRPSSRWADLAQHAHDIGAAWGLVLAPPFLSIVPTRGHATRRSLDVLLPLAVAPSSVAHLLAVAHASSFERTPGEAANTTHLDRLVRLGASFQDAVRVDLQDGVEHSLRVLEPALRSSARRAGPGRTPQTSPAGSRQRDEALTLVYRVLFLLFAESRRLVPNEAPLYRSAYAVSRFCRDAIEGDATGLWDALAATSRLSRLGCRSDDLQVVAFNGALFAKAAAPMLEQGRLRARAPHRPDGRDEAIRQILVALGSRRGRAGIETINFRDLGVEQLGAVYERVLDLAPDPASGGPTRRASRHSGVRRQTGTFYTPQPLAEFVVRRTLAPLVEGASSDHILDLRIVDPAMGSGAFLVAACRYLASAYEDALIEEGRLAPDEIDDNDRAGMRRTIAERCLSGVDRNPMAVHLARLSLWLTTLARDRPLGFLDHRLRTGDSLIGAWPGDLSRVAMRHRTHADSLPLFDTSGLDRVMPAAVRPLRALLSRPDDSVSDIRAKETAWHHFLSDASPLHRWRLACHLWCARWFPTDGVRPPDAAETRALIDTLVRGDATLGDRRVQSRVQQAVATAADRSFFHWPLEFPDLFYDNDGQPRMRPGYDAVIGNPPWEMVRQDDGTVGGTRELTMFVRQSGQYPSCSHGHLNLYQAFVDRTLSLVRDDGRVGLVLPWGMAADEGAAPLRRRLLGSTRVDTIVGLDNASALFPIHRGLRFAVVTATTGGHTHAVRAAFGVSTGAHLDALPARAEPEAYPVVLTPTSLTRASGASTRVPDARRPGELDLLLSVTERFPRLGAPEGWGVTFGRELNATEVRPHLSRAGIRIVEGKHLVPFRVQTGAARHIAPAALNRLLAAGRFDHPRVGYRDVSGVGNRLTLIAAVIPANVVTTHTVLCVRNVLDPLRQHFLCALLNSYVLNAFVRLLMGGHVTTTLTEHLPAPVWRGDRVDRRIARLAMGLSRRQALQGEEARLQALVARRFDLTPPVLRHLLDGFPLVPAAERLAVIEQFNRLDKAAVADNRYQ